MKILVVNICMRPYSPVTMFNVGLGYVMTAMDNAGYALDLLDIDAHRYSDAEFEGEVDRNSRRCNEAVGRGLDPEKLIKTGGYKNRPQKDRGAVAGVN